MSLNQVISRQSITGEQGETFRKTLSAPSRTPNSEFCIELEADWLIILDEARRTSPGTPFEFLPHINPSLRQGTTFRV